MSSTIHQCLGSGCPILAYLSNFSDYFGDEVVKYATVEEFRKKVVDLLEEGPLFKRSQAAVEPFLKTHDGPAVALEFLGKDRE